MQPTPAPVESVPASTNEVREPPEWNSWQVRLLQPAPRPLVPETGPPTVLPSSKPYLNVMPIIPPDALAEDVDLTDPEFPVFGVWKTAMTKAPYPLSRDAQAMENYKPMSADIKGFEDP
eukprot:1573955-Amphidinium_carterae.1